MNNSADFPTAKIPLNEEAGQMPALGFGTLIPDPATTISAIRDALEAGFRHFDCAERYRNERKLGETLQAGLAVVKTGSPGFIPRGK
jgi:aldehyde reductase